MVLKRKQIYKYATDSFKKWKNYALPIEEMIISWNN